jgi:formylmethanofuran dehydrogenase subunit D
MKLKLERNLIKKLNVKKLNKIKLSNKKGNILISSFKKSAFRLIFMLK